MVNIHPILLTLLLSFAINLLFYTFAAIFKTDKVTDLSYSLSFFSITGLLLLTRWKNLNISQIIIAAAIMLWALRLGTYLFYRILAIKEDHRFDDKRKNPWEFLKFWLLQASAVWIIMLPYTYFMAKESERQSKFFLFAGTTVYLLGLFLETISDIQKFRFRIKPENHGHWVDSGLWKYSRHPNYFGEMLFWWGLFIAVIPSLKGFYWFTLIGPVFITLLLLFVSGIPLLEKSSEERYGNNPNYLSYKKSTNMLIPLPKKND